MIDNKKYGQVLIIGDKVTERKYEKLKELFGTSHKIGSWEIDQLLENSPEIIMVGTGQDGQLEISENLLNKAKEKNIEIIAAITPETIKIYNEKVKVGKIVNALIHTTC